MLPGHTVKLDKIIKAVGREAGLNVFELADLN